MYTQHSYTLHIRNDHSPPNADVIIKHNASSTVSKFVNYRQDRLQQCSHVTLGEQTPSLEVDK